MDPITSIRELSEHWIDYDQAAHKAPECLFSFHIKILLLSPSWANAVQSSLSVCEWSTTHLSWDQQSREHFASEQETLAPWCCRGRGWSASCPLSTALLPPLPEWCCLFVTSERKTGKPSHVQAWHLLGRLPLLGTKHRAAQLCLRVLCSLSLRLCSNAATVGTSATRDREQAPLTSELL